jgi:hypothetical protein
LWGARRLLAVLALNALGVLPLDYLQFEHLR